MRRSSNRRPDDDTRYKFESGSDRPSATRRDVIVLTLTYKSMKPMDFDVEKLIRLLRCGDPVTVRANGSPPQTYEFDMKWFDDDDHGGFATGGRALVAGCVSGFTFAALSLLVKKPRTPVMGRF